MSSAEYVVHWPGKDTLACEDHAIRLRGLANALGIWVSVTPVLTEAECANCENELKSVANEHC